MISRWTAALVCALPAAFGTNADWQEMTAAFQTGESTATLTLNAHYAIGWSGIKAGELHVRLEHPDNTHRLQAEGGTTGPVRLLWKLDMDFLSLCNNNFNPKHLRQTEHYRAYSKFILSEFNPDSAKTWQWKSTEPRPESPETHDFLNIQSFHSALLILRTLPLRSGDTLSFLVLPGKSLYLVTMNVVGRERIDIRAGKKDAIRLDVNLHKVADNHTLEPHRKFKSCTAWVSADSRKIPLKIKADIFIGSVFAELEE